jgi:hypothetical protein
MEFCFEVGTAFRAFVWESSNCTNCKVMRRPHGEADCDFAAFRNRSTETWLTRLVHIPNGTDGASEQLGGPRVGSVDTYLNLV